MPADDPCARAKPIPVLRIPGGRVISQKPEIACWHSACQSHPVVFHIKDLTVFFLAAADFDDRRLHGGGELDGIAQEIQPDLMQQRRSARTWGRGSTCQRRERPAVAFSNSATTWFTNRFMSTSERLRSPPKREKASRSSISRPMRWESAIMICNNRRPSSPRRWA